MSGRAASVRRAEEASGEIAGILSRLNQQLGPARKRGGEDAPPGNAETDSGLDHGSLRTSLGEMEELLEGLRAGYEERVHQLEEEKKQWMSETDQREGSNVKLLQGYEAEGEVLAQENEVLSKELKSLQVKLKNTEASLKDKEATVRGLMEEMGAHQEGHRRASATLEGRVRRRQERVEEMQCRVREREKEVEEVRRELGERREMEQSLRSTLDECQEQLRNTLEELHRTQQDLQSAQSSLSTTNYSRQVQEEIVAQSRAYDALLKKLSQASTKHTSPLKEDTHSADLAMQLKDFLNPHLLSSHPSLSHTSLPTHSNTHPPPPSPSLPHSHHPTPPPPPTPPNHSHNNSLPPPPSSLTPNSPTDLHLAYQRYLNTFTDFTQRLRLGEYSSCPKGKVRLQRLQQWRHLFKELVLRPGGGLQLEECSLADVVSLMKKVAVKLGLPLSAVVVYGMERGRSGGCTLRFWLLRKEMRTTLQYEADGLLGDLLWMGRPVIFVSVGEPHGVPTPLEQWETAHHRVIDRLEEVPVGEVMGRERREESLDMVDLDPATELNVPSGEGEEEGGVRRKRGRGKGRRGTAAFHLRALLSTLCCCCSGGLHGHQTTRYRHLDEIYANSTHNEVL